MKKKVSLIFVSIFLMLGIVCGALVYNADTLFLTSTSESTQYEEKKDEETKIQASGNWSDNTNDYWTPGTKNGRRVYLIETATQLATLARQCNNGVGLKDNDGKFYSVFETSGHTLIDVYLENDIDMSAHYWDCPIGNGKFQFNVTFDGQGHTISGLTFKMSSSEVKSKISAYEGSYGIGLFGVVRNSTFKNFTLYGQNFTMDTYNQTISVKMGGVIGIVKDSEKIIMSGVINTAGNIILKNPFAENSSVGGLIGKSYSAEINDCYNFSKVQCRSKTNIGGLVGASISVLQIKNCGNFGEVYVWLTFDSGSGYGGIVGYATSANIEDCVNYGKVWVKPDSSSYQGQSVGGILGSGIVNVCINRCINYGEIKGTKSVGGIAGVIGIGLLGFTKNLISNCINYNKNISGSEYFGKICGVMYGAENIKACYVIGSENLCGKWYSQSSIEYENIRWWEANTYIWEADFYRYPSASYGHNYDFTGTHNFSVQGWKRARVDINCGVSSGWLITTLIYDYYGETSSVSRFGLNKNFGYSLVPASLVGTAKINVKYTRGGSTTYNFDNDETDETFMKISRKIVFGNNVAEVSSIFLYNSTSYNNGTAYYIRGLKDSSKNSLKFTYDTSRFKFKNVTANYNKASPTMGSDTYLSNSSRVNYLSFNPMGKSSITFDIVFDSVRRTVAMKYKVGRLNKTSNNAWFDYIEIETGYLNGFLTKSAGTSQSFYYKQDVNFEITPNKGYAVLSIIKKTSGSIDLNMDDVDKSGEPSGTTVTIKDKRSVCSSHYLIVSTRGVGSDGTVVFYEDINPSDFGTATVNFESTSLSTGEEIVVYIAPIQYDDINVTLNKVGLLNTEEINDGKNHMNKKTYAFEGEGGVYVDKYSKKARSRFKTMQLTKLDDIYVSESTTETNRIFSDYINYGYKYTLNGDSYNRREDAMEESGTQLSIQPNIQLNTSKSIEFSMSALLDAAIQKDSERSNQTLHIVIKRELINYEVNLINMVDSYKSTAYSSKTDIGGNSNIYKENDSSKNLFKGNVEDFAGYKFVAKAGYCFGGTRMYLTNTAMLGVEADPFNMSNYTEKKFQKILDKYMEICNWDVKNLSKNSDGKYVLKIYAYYTLQSYNVSFYTEIDGSQKSANYTFTPTNFASSQTKASGEGTKATATAKYYAPVTLRVDSVDGNRKNVKFLGWFMGDKLLSLDREYKFLLDPEYLVTDNSKISGEIKGKENSSNYGFNLVARFASYNEGSGSLTSSGNKTIYINNATDLLLLSQKVNSGTTYEGYVIKQTANIDMKDVIFNPIGTSEHQFKGTYDGQNYIISNLKFICGAYNGYLKHLYNVGLFGYTNGATIKNLTIKDSTFNAFGKAGIFVAEAYNSHLANLNNFNSGLTLNAVNFFDIYGNECNSQDLNYARIKGSLPAELSDANNSSFDWTTRLYPNSRSNLAGLVGYMNGGSAFACSVNASIEGNAGFSTFQGLVGNLTASAKIDQCCVENSSNNGGLTVANTTSGITNSYYRYSTNTKYVGTSLSGSTQNAIPTDTTIWFRLANGNWALRVMYWS